MPNTTDFSFADVVLVPFPFTDQTASKKRPAVVVSSAEYNARRPDVIVMAITGNVSHHSRLGEVIVADWKAAGLLKDSTVKPILTTIEKSLVIRTLGQLTARDATSLKDVLTHIIG
jgi:mRNA interferase MazF